MKLVPVRNAQVALAAAAGLAVGAPVVVEAAVAVVATVEEVAAAAVAATVVLVAAVLEAVEKNGSVMIAAKVDTKAAVAVKSAGDLLQLDF